MSLEDYMTYFCIVYTSLDLDTPVSSSLAAL